MIKTVKIVGPFFSEYSLAKVNRGLAEALSEYSDLKIFCFCQKEKIDKIPTEKDFESYSFLKNLWSDEDIYTDLAIYNNYPKSGLELHGLKNLSAKIKTAYLAWEETIYPKIWVDEINQNLHAVFVISDFVVEVLRKSGVNIPIFNINLGLSESLKSINLNDNVKLKLPKGKFLFFHNSTGKVRKGTELLINAFCEEFKSSENVSLVIKSTPNPDNVINENLENYGKNLNILHICQNNLSEKEISYLIKNTHVGVYPSRTEGFGLPILESMYFKRPVICTAYSGILDFATEKNSLLLDYKLSRAIGSEQGILGSNWAEPKIDLLKFQMRYIYNEYTSSKIKFMIENAYKTSQLFTFKNTAKCLLENIEKIFYIEKLKKQKLVIKTKSETVKKNFLRYKSIFKKLKFSNSDYDLEIAKDSILEVEEPEKINKFHIKFALGLEKIKEIVFCQTGCEKDFISLVNFLGKDNIFFINTVGHNSDYSFSVNKNSKFLNIFLQISDIAIFETVAPSLSTQLLLARQQIITYVKNCEINLITKNFKEFENFNEISIISSPKPITEDIIQNRVLEVLLSFQKQANQ